MAEPEPSIASGEAGSLFGSGFFAGFFTASSLLCCGLLAYKTLRKRQLNRLGGSPLQAVLEVDETADRLRMVLRRLREVKGQLGGK